ncbi:MAG: response regulator, partial [Flavobacterium sp.]
DILYSGTLEVPEIVFLDINMPGKSGFDCLQEIRCAQGHLDRMRIIMLSTSGTPENIKRSFELGADLYAVKPSTFAELKEMLGEILALEPGTVQINKNKVYSTFTGML